MVSSQQTYSPACVFHFIIITNPTSNLLNSINTHINPIYQTTNNSFGESTDFDIHEENRMEYQQNYVEENTVRAFDSAEFVHGGLTTQNHHVNSANHHHQVHSLGHDVSRE